MKTDSMQTISTAGIKYHEELEAIARSSRTKVRGSLLKLSSIANISQYCGLFADFAGWYENKGHIFHRDGMYEIRRSRISFGRSYDRR